MGARATRVAAAPSVNVHGRDHISIWEDLSVHAPPRAEADSAAEAITRTLLCVFAFGVATDAMPLFGLARPAPIFAAVLVLPAALHVIRTGRLRPGSLTLFLLTAFTAWGGASLLWTQYPDPARERLVTNVQLMLSTWLLWQIARDGRDLRAMLAGYVAGCSVVAAGAWHSFVTGVTYVEQQFEGVPWADEQRYVAAGFDPNDMGVTLAIAVPMAVFLAMQGEGRLRHLWFAYAPLALSAIALSGSRGAATAGVVASFCVLWWIGRRSVTAMAVALGLLALGGAAVWVLSPDSWERIFTARQQVAGGGSVGERLPIWRASAELLARHPVTGVGVGAFSNAIAQHLGYAIVAHNTIISLVVEGGAVGALLFLGGFASVAHQIRRSEPPHRALAQALILVWLVGTFSLSWEYRKTTWFLLLLGAVLARLRASVAGTDPA